MTLKVLDFSKKESDRDLPTGLRELADRIESGDMGKVNRLAWVMDTEDSLRLGILGLPPGTVAQAHYLFSKASHYLVNDEE